jgi:hypothetical protein
VTNPSTADVLEGLERLLRDGVSILFVYPEPTTVLEYFRMTIAPHLDRLERSGEIRAEVLKGAEHTFRELTHQQQVQDLAVGWLDRQRSAGA